MLPYAYDLGFQSLQPIVCLEDGLFVKTRQPPGEATLVSALGARHPLRRLCPADGLAENRRRLDGPAVRRLLQEELARRTAAGITDALRYFVEVLVPAFGERDWSEGYQVPAAAAPQSAPPDLAERVAALAETAPPAELPSPSLLVLGRAWLLRPEGPVPGRVQVRRGEATLGPTGEYLLLGTLEREWRDKLGRFVAEAAQQLATSCRPPEDGAALGEAREAVARTGCFLRGDLLFLAGSPPRLGYVLPPHENRALGRYSSRDLAMTAPLTLPPPISFPAVYQRGAAGRWEPCPVPHGLCLGAGPPNHRPESPGVALAAYLRWAALRVAANGKFHSGDDNPAGGDYGYDS